MADAALHPAPWPPLKRQSDTRFSLVVEPSVCVGPPEGLFLFGGMGLSASLSALQAVTGRRGVWATAQYLSYARPGEEIVFDVHELVRGHAVSQARVVAHVGTREVLTVVAALGERSLPAGGQWTHAPAAPPPLACPRRELWPDRHPDDIHARIEFRIAHGAMHGGRGFERPGDGRTVVWARPDPTAFDRPPAIDAAWAALVADYVPSGVGPALGRRAGGNSLDNSIRFHRMVPTGWLLCDIRVHAVARGFGHGRMHLFARTGELIATASQSMIVRLWD